MVTKRHKHYHIKELFLIWNYLYTIICKLIIINEDLTNSFSADTSSIKDEINAVVKDNYYDINDTSDINSYDAYMFNLQRDSGEDPCKYLPFFSLFIDIHVCKCVCI